MLKKLDFSHIIFQYLLLFILIYLVIFLKIDAFHMRWWDESMFAVNTYEMMSNHKYLSLYFDNSPDLFNTKPPLTNWLQLFFAKIFGYNELSMRLPSAISSALSIVVVFNYLKNNFNLKWAWISALILLTSFGFIGFHTSRTGESDAILTLFLLLANINFINFLIKDKTKYILWFMIFLTLAFATKLYAALLFSLGYLFLLFYFKKIKSFFLNKYFLLGIIVFMATSVSLIYLREFDTPGYIDEILNKDAGRILKVVENHKENYFYYLDNLFTVNYSFWIIFLILSIFLIQKSNQTVKILLFSLLVLIISYLVIITISITKLSWYDMPLFPYLSIMSAYGINYIIDSVFRDKSEKFKYFLIAAIFLYPYSLMFHQSQVNHIPKGERDLESNEIFIYNAFKAGKNLDNVKVLTQSWKGSLLFYKYKLKENNQQIYIINDLDKIKKGDKVLTSDSNLKQELKNKFNIKELDNNQKSILYLIE